MSSRAPIPLPLLLLAAVLLSGLLWLGACGGDDEGPDDPDAALGSADPEAERVIDEWSTALREGDIDAAAAYFKVPSVVQNGTPPLDLDSRQDVITFNEALPCGAELVEAESHAGFTIATFELTERPGPGECGDGVGGTAQTAFVIEDGKITEWRRIGGEAAPVAPPVEGPVV